MAVFEKNIRRKEYLDDTQVLRCSIVNTENIQGHTEYVIKVERGPGNNKSWNVFKRYNDFVALHNALQGSTLNIQLPPKKFIGNFDREFIAERQAGLEKYLNLVLMNPILASSLPVRRFLDPENYSVPFQEIALQHVSLALRGDVEFEVLKPIPDMGWRIRKHFFQAKKRSNPKEEFVLSWTEYGPDKYIDDKEMQAVFKVLTAIKHPNIAPVEAANASESGSFAIRKLQPDGSLRDVVCHCKPRLPFLKKYASPKQCSALPLPLIISTAYQILQALLYLKSKGVPYGHLHLGNISFVNKETVQLLDIENGILGLPSYYRPYFIQHRKISSLEAIDVYCFGHVIYEITFGRPLHEQICDNIPSNCPPELRPIFESILSSAACKSGLPTLESLLKLPIFPMSQVASSEFRCTLKLSTTVKEALKNSCEKSATHLEEEQKKIRHHKRLVKMQEVLSAEENQRNDKKRNKNATKKNGKIVNGHGHENSLSRKSSVTNMANGISPERSDSPNSISTATSVGTLTPPAGAPPPPPPPMPTPAANSASLASIGVNGVDDKRTALLGSICNFNKAALKKTKQTA
ncbi:PX domain-containing protein kinase-like protein [Nilaparvata lugens]|uniref:PX domain-containing protein kinase-like protein n=1 Tax=Nilaparvata lugens TaxID=108931 RepID=UPI00193E96FB|nr:PX domain-containing protein kinase-like protein [Nilaparvata lugens]